jgi:pyruvate dehydrogenase (quinone)
MLLRELLTLVQNDLPMRVVVFNNSSLNFVELEMKAADILNLATDLRDPNFAAVAEAIGIFGRAPPLSRCPAVIRNSLASGRGSLITTSARMGFARLHTG